MTIMIHLPRGRWDYCSGAHRCATIITIHPPRGGRDTASSRRRWASRYFNPPAPWGAGRGLLQHRDHHRGISIHPPRGGRDRRLRPPLSSWAYFNPPAPWGAGRVTDGVVYTIEGFQSTRPVGGGTWVFPVPGFPLTEFQSTRPVGGGTIPPPSTPRASTDFNPPAPWGAGPCRRSPRFCPGSHFNPPAPWGAGRLHRHLPVLASVISIHPPRGGRDPPQPWTARPSTYFNPPAPWGAGLRRPLSAKLTPAHFNPPAPWGAGQPLRPQVLHKIRISIHPPRGGRDNTNCVLAGHRG